VGVAEPAAAQRPRPASGCCCDTISIISTNATRADQIAYARGTITAGELRDRVRRRYNVQ
jgi:hypothetical protein